MQKSSYSPVYSDSEIYRIYRNSDDPNIIKILTELTLYSESHIKEIIRIKENEEIMARTKIWTEERVRRVRELYFVNTPIEDIAQEFHVTVSAVRSCISRYNMYREKLIRERSFDNTEIVNQTTSSSLKVSHASADTKRNSKSSKVSISDRKKDTCGSQYANGVEIYETKEEKREEFVPIPICQRLHLENSVDQIEAILEESNQISNRGYCEAQVNILAGMLISNCMKLLQEYKDVLNTAI